MVFHTVVFGALFGFYLPVISFVRIPLRFFIVWVFSNPFVFFPPFWFCSLKKIVFAFFQSIALFSFSTPFVLSPYLGFSLLPFGFPPTLAFLVLISLSPRAPVEIPADVFSPSFRVFPVWRSACPCFARSLSGGGQKMILTYLSKSPINKTGFLFVWHNSSQSG